MAKSGKHTGTSFTEEELSDPVPPVTITRAVLGGETPSPGKTSSTSGAKTNKDDESQTRNPQKPVSSTESPSSQPVRGADSAAPSAATGGQKTAQESGRKRTPATSKKNTPDDSKKARVRSADGDDDFADFE